MKLCKVPIRIEVLNDTRKEKELAMRHNIQKFEQKLYFTKNDKPIKNDDVPKIRPELPGLDVTFIPLFIKKVIFVCSLRNSNNNINFLCISFCLAMIVFFF